MTQVKNKNEVYKCEVCGNIVEVIHVGGGELVCCGKPMILQIENTEDASVEKHMPVFERNGNDISVKIGEVSHPMEENHYIEWIEIIADGKIYRQELYPGGEPRADFFISSKNISVRAYCNLHGIWKNNK